jgi:hypothetical protein
MLGGIDASRGRGSAGQGCSTCELVPTKRGALIQQLGRARARDRARSTGRAGRSEEGKRLTCRFFMDRLRSQCSFSISRSEQLRTGEVQRCLPLYHNVSKCQKNVCVPNEHRMSLTPGERKRWLCEARRLTWRHPPRLGCCNATPEEGCWKPPHHYSPRFRPTMNSVGRGSTTCPAEHCQTSRMAAKPWVRSSVVRAW